MKALAHTTFDDLPDVALIQIRPLINFKVVPYSATTIWRKSRSGEFPSPIKLSRGWHYCLASRRYPQLPQ